MAGISYCRVAAQENIQMQIVGDPIAVLRKRSHMYLRNGVFAAPGVLGSLATQAVCLGADQVLSYCHGDVYGLLSDYNGLAQVSFDERIHPKELSYPK